MKIETREVERIAKLSKLAFNDSELEAMRGHLESVLGYFEKLDSVDTSSVKPTAHILDKVNVLREDVAKKSDVTRAELLANCTSKTEEAYVVPRVVE